MVQTYNRTEDITSQTGLSYVQNNNNTTRGFDKLSSAIGQGAEIVYKKIKEADDLNKLGYEKNQLLQKSFEIEDEIANTPLEERDNLIRERYSDYQSELENRVTDKRMMVKLSEDILSNQLLLQRKTREEKLKSIKDEGLATGLSGDEIFMGNVQRNLNDNATLYNQLYDRFSFWDGLAEKGHIQKSDAERRKNELGKRTELEVSRLRMEQDPQKELSALNNPDVYMFLSDNKPALINQAQSEIKRLEAIKRQEQALYMQNQSIEFGLFKQDAALAIKEYQEKGVKPANYDQILKQIDQYSKVGGAVGKSATFLENIMRTQGDIISPVIEFKNKSFIDQETYINENIDRYQSGQMDAKEQSTFERTQKIYNDSVTAKSSGDLISYARKYNILNVERLDLADPLSIRKRQIVTQSLSDRFNTSANILSDDEVKGLTQKYKDGSAQDQQQIGNALIKLTNGNQELMNRTLRQIKAKDESIVEEVAALARGDVDLAQTMSNGRKRIANNPDSLGDINKKLNVTINKLIDETTLSAFDADNSRRKSILTGVKNAYAGSISETLDSSEINNDLLEQAFNKYVGGSLSMNGHKTVSFLKNQSESQQKDYWRNLTDGQLMTLSNQDHIPQYVSSDGNKKPVDIKRIRDEAIPVPYRNGKYIMAMKTINGWTYLTDNKGGPYLLDFSKGD